MIAMWIIIMTDLEMFNELCCFVLSPFSDQVLSITPKTQEQVDIVKNVSSQYEVEMFFFLFLKLRCPHSPILSSD